MDDGYKSGKGLYISTESFSLHEIKKILVKILNNKFCLKSNYHKVTNGYRIYLSCSCKPKFVEIVKPYLLKHFYYKLDLSNFLYFSCKP